VGIINGDGVMIARSDQAADRVGMLVDTDVARAMVRERRGTARGRGYEGIDRIAIFGPVGNTDWIAFVALDAGSVMVPAREMAIRRFTTLLGILAALGLLTFLLGRRITRPIEAISATISGIRAGRPELRATEGGPMEVHQIAVELNAMLDASAKSNATLRELNESLERRIELRTAELTMANAELDSFSYAIAHDLRAPLRSVDGFAQIIEEDHGAALGAEGLDKLRHVRDASRRMSELIEDLLRLSSTMRGSMDVRPFDLSGMARSIVDNLQHAQPGRRVEFVAPATLEVSADRRLVLVLLENLLNNAWKFTGRRETAHIELGQSSDAGVPAYFVRDDGAGFDMAYAGKLFMPFSRLHAVHEFPGTGIGLATVQRIVQRHGGRAWAEGAPGKGATFYFTLGR
jgi:signal transduction histidine kinase